jgi:hypothetical protein
MRSIARRREGGIEPSPEGIDVPSPTLVRYELASRIAIVITFLGMTRSLDIHFVKEPIAQLPQAMSVPTIDARYAGIRKDLPAHGRVGYISDLPLDHEEGDALHLQTLYALAPLIVARDDGSPGLVIANLSRPSALPEICRRARLDLVRDYGSGLSLLRRRGAP